MNIYLAPMEGVVDHHMRAVVTKVGGFHACVTEFIRVVDRLLPEHVFLRYCPELQQGGKTAAGIPVVIQLLGGLPEIVAINAQRAVELGAPGVDINFGCPSKTVNRKAGGAVLLKKPDRIYNIVRAVRKALPGHIPVSGKIRLGYEDTALTLENAHAVADGGASLITVHARTKVDGYIKPARWQCLAPINEELTIPVIANGDINSEEDYRRCVEISGCENIMIGRGALSRPDLALQIKNPDVVPFRWPHIHHLLVDMYVRLKQQSGITERRILGRIKQWLAWLKREYSEAQQAFDELRYFTETASLERWFEKG